LTTASRCFGCGANTGTRLKPAGDQSRCPRRKMRDRRARPTRCALSPIRTQLIASGRLPSHCGAVTVPVEQGPSGNHLLVVTLGGLTRRFLVQPINNQ
jgi:hypothetical protein